MTHNIDIGCMLDRESSEAIYQELIKLPKTGRLLETGTGWGHSSKFFSEVLPEWTIYTVDAFGIYGDGRIYSKYDGADVAKIIKSHPANVIQILSDAASVKWELSIDVLYIDDDHRYEGCKAVYERYSPFLTDNALVIFDDYIQENNPTNGVKRVVDEVRGEYDVLYTGISAILKKK